MERQTYTHRNLVKEAKEGSETMKKMIWVCVKCGAAFPEGLPYGTRNCPYCDGELKLHRVVDPLTYELEKKGAIPKERG